MSSRIECLFRLLDEDYCTDKQIELVDSFREQFIKFGTLSVRQVEILESISEQAANRDYPCRR